MPLTTPTPLTALEEGVVITTRTKMNFVGTSVTVTEDAPNDRILVTITGGGVGGGDFMADGSVPLTGDIDFAGTQQCHDLQAPAAVGEAIRQTAVITEASVDDAIDKAHSNSLDHSVNDVGTHGTATTGVHGVGAGTIAKTADITATKIDDLTAGDDNTDLDSNTTRHGLLLKAVAPAVSLLNVPGIVNGETVFTNKPIFDATNPANLGVVAPGTAVVAAHRDHVHANPAIDTLAAATDITTLDASISAHGLVVKAVAPAAGLYNYVGITNGETAFTNKVLFDATVPSTQAYSDAAAVGTAVVASRRDHKHAMPAIYAHPNHSGEVTSAGDGAQTIANDAVTYAKMQNVSATDKVLGRATAGAGDVEEIACTAAGRALLDDANAAAQLVTLGDAAAAVASINASGAVLADAKAVEYTTPSVSHTASGVFKTKTAGIALVFGDACYMGTDGKMEKALADDAAITIPATHLAIATIAENAAGLFLEQGEAHDDSWAFDIGLSVYLSAATAGLITKTMPTKVTGNQVQVLGTAIAADTIYWNPSMVVMEYA